MARRKPAVKEEPRNTIEMQPSPYSGDAFIAAATRTTDALAIPEKAPITVPEGHQTPEFALELAKRRIHQFKGIVKLIASEVNPKDIFVFAGYKVKTEEDLLGLKAYLPLHTCQSILAWSGAIWMPDKEMIERRGQDELGHFIEYDQWVDVMTADNREVRVMGSCSTRHNFHGLAFTFWACPACRTPLGYKEPCPTHGQVKARKLNAYKPLCDVNCGNVRKHAITNSFNKAVDALGLTPTLRDLKDAGMDITKIPRANFGGRDNDDEGSSGQGASQNNPQKSSGTPMHTPATSQTSRPAQPPTSAAQTPSAGNTPNPPKASSPPKALDPIVAGMLVRCVPSRTKSKKNDKGEEIGDRPFLFLEVNDGHIVKLATFDNKELTIDTRGGKSFAFTLLALAVNKKVALRTKQVGAHQNVTMYLQIGELEWDSDGTPILRREGAYEPTDEDLGLNDTGESVDGFPGGVAGEGKW